MSKQELKDLMNCIPLDSLQREVADAGVDNLTDEEAASIAKELREVFESLPKVVAELDKILDEQAL